VNEEVGENSIQRRRRDVNYIACLLFHHELLMVVEGGVARVVEEVKMMMMILHHYIYIEISIFLIKHHRSHFKVYARIIFEGEHESEEKKVKLVEALASL
jgi:hypothetical protein